MKKNNIKVLLVYPEYPETFWSFKYALKFIHKKAAFPPLGLLTVASMLPEKWEKELIDMNVRKLKDKHIKSSDIIMISAMNVQKKSVMDILKRCSKKNIKVIAGGPLFSLSYEDYIDYVDHFILNEVENSFPEFLNDFKKDKAKKIYNIKEHPDLSDTPTPMWELLDFNKYSSMNIQYSRGCPYNCEFCNITALYGRKIRTKDKYQILYELETLYNSGWKGGVFFVDDNFIGNKRKLKKEILPAIESWMKKKDYPFSFLTEASLDLADEEDLIKNMIKAGFESVFVGIETPEKKSLEECNKVQNKNRDLLESVKKIQSIGLEVKGGFILGFDNDPPSIFNQLINFIQKSGIITAMVGLLNAPKKTRLYKRLKKEKRLTGDISGDNTDFSINFIPKMDPEKLKEGYKKVVKTIYSCKPYYERVKEFLSTKKVFKYKKAKNHFKFSYLIAFLKSIFVLGIKDKGRKYYWKLLFWALFKKPRVFHLVVVYSIYGFHFRKIFNA